MTEGSSSDQGTWVVAPLSNFRWEEKSFEIPGLGTVQPFGLTVDPQRFRKVLSDNEIEKIRGCRHWLKHLYRHDSGIPPATVLFLFQFLLWLAVPTRTQIEYRFESPDPDAPAPAFRVFRILDQFHWLESDVSDTVSTANLKEMLDYAPALLRIVPAGGRLHNSLQLTYAGLTSVLWQARFICFSATMEGLLTSGAGPGIARRIAKSFVFLTCSTREERDATYDEFRRLYGIRSDIMHGRTRRLMEGNSILEELSRYENLLRALWKSILRREDIWSALEKSNRERERFLKRIVGGYESPGK